MLSFAAVSAITETAPGQFDADVDPQWTVGGKPHGGYLLALMGRAAAAVGSHPDPIAASAHYLWAPAPGPVRLEAEALRVGRSATQVRVRMSQAGRPCVEALITTADLPVGGGAYWDRGLPGAHGATGANWAAWAECVRVPPVTPLGLAVAVMGQVDLRIDPATLDFAAGRPSGRGELRGWLELADGEAFDPIALLYAVDAFPPATFEIELTGWVPTMELTAYVRARPAPGPLRVLQRAQLIDAQRVDESCFVWDSTGRLVAQATQLAAIRLG